MRKDDYRGSIMAAEHSTERGAAMLQKKTAAIGLVFSLLLAVGALILSLQFFNNHELVRNAIFHAGMNALGTFVCAMLYFGCMRQVDCTTRSFIILPDGVRPLRQHEPRQGGRRRLL